MARKIQGPAEAGSQKWLQRLVNDDPDRLNVPIAAHLGLEGPGQVTWLSPVRDDSYAEYRDDEFLDLLGVDLDRRPRREFWPSGGPV